MHTARFAEPRAEQVHRTGFARGLPESTSRKAFKVIRLLLASRDLRDVSVIGGIAVWPNDPDCFGLHVERKWFVTFRWDPRIGAVEIRLTRR
jgi:plasmid maintenance system killer protein